MGTLVIRVVLWVLAAVIGILAISFLAASAVHFFVLICETYGPNATAVMLAFLAMAVLSIAIWFDEMARNM